VGACSRRPRRRPDPRSTSATRAPRPPWPEQRLPVPLNPVRTTTPAATAESPVQSATARPRTPGAGPSRLRLGGRGLKARPQPAGRVLKRPQQLKLAWGAFLPLRRPGTSRAATSTPWPGTRLRRSLFHSQPPPPRKSDPYRAPKTLLGPQLAPWPVLPGRGSRAEGMALHPPHTMAQPSLSHRGGQKTLRPICRLNTN
jgi:hypothetical protein